MTGQVSGDVRSPEAQLRGIARAQLRRVPDVNEPGRWANDESTELKLLSSLVMAIQRGQTLEETCSQALELISTTLPNVRAGVLLPDVNGVMQFKAWHGLSGGYRQALAGHCPWSKDESEPKPIFSAAVISDEVWSSYRSLFLAEGVRALAFIPLLQQRRLVGVLMLCDSEGRAFTGRELDLLQVVAAQLSPVVAREDFLLKERLAHAAAERSAEQLRWLQTLTAQLSDAVTIAQVANIMVLEGVSATGAASGGVWLLRGDWGNVDGAPGQSGSGPSSGDPSELIQVASYSRPGRDSRTKLGLDTSTLGALLGVIQGGAPAWLPAQEGDVSGRGVMACLPVVADGKCDGALVYTFDARDVRTADASDVGSFDTAGQLDRGEREFLLNVARLGGLALARTRHFERERAARALAEAAHRRSSLEAHASAAFASSFDYEATLRNITRVAVPTFADWCTVELGDAPGRSILVAVEHVDPTKVALAWELRARYPNDPASTRGVSQVLRTAKAELEGDIADGALAREAVDAEHLRLLEALGRKSSLTVPISVPGRTLGVVSFVRTRAGKPYDVADLEVAVALGQRAGLAIEKAKLHHELQRAIGTRDELLAVVSHDLRTPLAVISLTTELMARELAGETKQTQRHLDRIHANVDCMNRLIGDLLDVSSIESGQMKIQLAHEDLSTLLARAVEQLQPLARSKSIRLVAKRPAQPVFVRGDRQRISRVLHNLVGNSIKFTPTGGAIVLSAAREGSMVRFSVKDNGTGIDAAHLPRLFDRHYQTVPGEHDGVGLGLFIARNIIEAHGGHIWADSSPGKGSEFSFTLPVAPCC